MGRGGSVSFLRFSLLMLILVSLIEWQFYNRYVVVAWCMQDIADTYYILPSFDFTYREFIQETHYINHRYWEAQYDWLQVYRCPTFQGKQYRSMQLMDNILCMKVVVESVYFVDSNSLWNMRTSITTGQWENNSKRHSRNTTLKSSFMNKLLGDISDNKIFSTFLSDKCLRI